MPTPSANKGEVKEAIEPLGKLYRGLVALGKEVLPEDTEKLKQQASAYAHRIHEAAEAFKTVLEDKPSGTLQDIRNLCRQSKPLDGTSAELLEHALTCTEQERDLAVGRFHTHNQQLLALLHKGKEIDIDAVLAHIRKAI